MNLERIGQWVGILANVGVLVGFLLVAYQLELNTTALQTTSTHKTNELISTLESSLMGDTGNKAFSQAMMDPHNISPEEMSQMWTLSSLSLQVATQVYFDYRNGVVSEERWNFVAEQYIGYINHPIGLSFWESSKGVFADHLMVEFIAVIDAKLNEIPKNQTQKQFLEMMKHFSVKETPDA